MDSAARKKLFDDYDSDLALVRESLKKGEDAMKDVFALIKREKEKKTYDLLMKPIYLNVPPNKREEFLAKHLNDSDNTNTLLDDDFVGFDSRYSNETDSLDEDDFDLVDNDNELSNQESESKSEAQMQELMEIDENDLPSITNEDKGMLLNTMAGLSSSNETFMTEKSIFMPMSMEKMPSTSSEYVQQRRTQDLSASLEIFQEESLQHNRVGSRKETSLAATQTHVFSVEKSINTAESSEIWKDFRFDASVRERPDIESIGPWADFHNRTYKDKWKEITDSATASNLLIFFLYLLNQQRDVHTQVCDTNDERFLHNINENVKSPGVSHALDLLLGNGLGTVLIILCNWFFL